MSCKPIREIDGKRILAKWLGKYTNDAQEFDTRNVQITPETNWDDLLEKSPWLGECKLVAKPDQLIKRRGKNGLLKLNATFEEAKTWVMERMNKEITIDNVMGELNTFLIEPFVPHDQSDEYYVCIQSNRTGEEILFYHAGGVDIGDVDAKAEKTQVPIGTDPNDEQLFNLVRLVVKERQEKVVVFIKGLFKLYAALHFSYLEINPLTFADGKVLALDLAAKLDETAAFLASDLWGKINFPSPFGRPLTKEEQYISDLDSKTGASLKLTILNPKGRIWTMVAGGGASVVYADSIADSGFGHELANYGEYSGAPTEGLTFEYAKTVLSLVTRTVDERGKILIIGGGIANFTDVKKTFKGIVRALKQYGDQLIEGGVKIWVRRGGPNFEEGLKLMKQTGESLGLDMKVFGPETHITAIVPMSLGLETTKDLQLNDNGSGTKISKISDEEGGEERKNKEAAVAAKNASMECFALPQDRREDAMDSHSLFNAHTEAVVFGMQVRAVQGMLDFDYMARRKKPSVACMVFPFKGNHYQKFYWGTEEILMPVYQKLSYGLKRHPNVDCMINFSSFRSAYGTSMEALNHPQIRSLAIIAEGIPERQSRMLLKAAEQRKVTVIGPATVGGIKAGCFRIGNSGGMINNIISSKLYRPGSGAYVSKSGGMSNELNNMLQLHADGVYEGVAIGGDRYPGTRFIDHILRYQDNPAIKMILLLGEVGGIDEYDVCKALKDKRITKPVIAWCIGTCAKIFPYEVQFGHAGALALSAMQTADAKNTALREAGALVPETFDKYPALIAETYQKLIASGDIVPFLEPAPQNVPMDYNWAKNLGIIRKPSAFVSSIVDERGEELLYAGMKITDVFEQDLGIGGVLALLWFRKRLPPYATKFIEMILMVTADHGPAVSGAHNTIVTARAGKDLISSLVSGLLTIGPRFGGALDEAAKMFTEAHDNGSSAQKFVGDMRKQNKLIMGIGHKIKSIQNPDARVTIVKEYAKKHFPSTPILDFALEVEQVTTKKKNNLILNVDGCIAACFVDMMRNCGAFEKEEVSEIIANGALNGMFVLGRSMGFIGHYLDQKRLKQGLYRHPWDDISYIGTTLSELETST